MEGGRPGRLVIHYLSGLNIQIKWSCTGQPSWCSLITSARASWVYNSKLLDFLEMRYNEAAIRVTSEKYKKEGQWWIQRKSWKKLIYSWMQMIYSHFLAINIFISLVVVQNWCSNACNYYKQPPVDVTHERPPLLKPSKDCSPSPCSLYGTVISTTTSSPSCSWSADAVSAVWFLKQSTAHLQWRVQNNGSHDSLKQHSKTEFSNIVGKAF